MDTSPLPAASGISKEANRIGFGPAAFQPEGTCQFGSPSAPPPLARSEPPDTTGADAGAGADDEAEASGADSPPPPPVSTDFNQAKNCGFCSATSALSPVILKNTVISPAGMMAASVRAGYLPSRTAFLPSSSYITTWRLPAGIIERRPAKSASVAGSSPIWSRQRLTFSNSPPAPPPMATTEISTERPSVRFTP